MLDRDHFARDAEPIVAWIDSYLREIRTYPVKSTVSPGSIREQIPLEIPEEGASISSIMREFEEILIPGMTHWQHPNFHAYFNANSSTESLLAEMLTAALGAQCMIWETSPAAAELEECVVKWLRDAMGFDEDWEGVIQDTASTATLSAIITAREKVMNFQTNFTGLREKVIRVYCSTETHSSIDKAVAIAGIGRDNIVRIDVDASFRMTSESLDRAITSDLERGMTPCIVIVTLGTTGIMAIDDIASIASVCEKHNVWLHVDAAYAGTALLLPEWQWMIRGVDRADSFVFNPHKWMFTNFDCTVYLVKNVADLIKSFEIDPVYLQTGTRGLVNDYRDWGIQLGRRFRALKLWFVIKSYGLKGIQRRLRHHIDLAADFADWVDSRKELQLMLGPTINYVAFRYQSPHHESLQTVNDFNRELLNRINLSGQVFLSHTLFEGAFIIRVLLGQTYIEADDVERLKATILEEIGNMVQ